VSTAIVRTTELVALGGHLCARCFESATRIRSASSSESWCGLATTDTPCLVASAIDSVEWPVWSTASIRSPPVHGQCAARRFRGSVESIAIPSSNASSVASQLVSRWLTSSVHCAALIRVREKMDHRPAPRKTGLVQWIPRWSEIAVMRTR